jgi:hypothetical protein
LVGTSPTVVTAFATADCVLRLAVGVVLLLAATVGESLAALPVVARRIGVVVADGAVAADASCAARGSPLDGAACGLGAVCRRVAVLVGETSLAAVLALVVAAGVSAAWATFGKLGAPVWRVSVGVVLGVAVAAGLSRPWLRAIRAAGCSRLADCGCVEGI